MVHILFHVEGIFVRHLTLYFQEAVVVAFCFAFRRYYLPLCGMGVEFISLGTFPLLCQNVKHWGANTFSLLILINESSFTSTLSQI